jgi:UDP-N-acetylmuramoylalanine--D-glutamate ligase
MKSLIFGYGITGRSFARYLRKKGIDFDIYDEKVKGPVRFLDDRSPPEVNIFWQLPDREKLESYKIVYLSPGINIKKIYPNGEFYGIPRMTDLTIFFDEDHSYKIGITGTNGKSTFCHHLNQILDDSQLIGNIGNPVLDNINTGCKYSIIELSSFQLEKVYEIKLDLGVILNITPDHIDYHGSFKEYSRVKNRIKESKFFTEESDPKKIWSIITNLHHETLSDFQFSNLPHRFESIDGLCNSFINDSKATNTASLEYALNKMSGDCYLILCGDPNKEQYKNYKIIGPKKVFIFGAHAREIYKRVSHPKKILLHNNNLEYAMHLIKDDKDLDRSTSILFSPGHPSGNDYNHFEERGNHFKQLVQEIFCD